MKTEKFKLSIWMSLYSLMDRKGRASREHVRYFFVFYIAATIAVMYLRVQLGLVQTEPLYDSEGAFIMNFGYWPKFDLISWGVFIAEGIFLHIPFYTLCIRRLNDLGYGSIRALLVFIAVITPLLGIPFFIYFFMIKKGEPTENKWGPVPRTFESILLQ